MASGTVAEWAAANHYDIGGQSGEEATELFANLESNFAWTLQELGAAEVDPATLDIPQP